ncbi:MAG: leucyl aminopeptidase [Synergistaceae bacterium]|nr:leucyl aminopeptidase [Synergistaceae bacterium]
MNIRTPEDGFSPESADVIGILVYEAEPDTVCLDPLRAEMRDLCRRNIMNEGFKGKAGTSLKISVADKAKAVRTVVLCGLGEEDGNDGDKIRECVFNVVREAASKGLVNTAIYLPKACEKNSSCSAAEGAVLGSYRFDKYLTREADDRFKRVENVVVIDGNEDGLREGYILAESQCYTRDIANEPGNVVTPQVLAEKASELAEELGLGCEIWDQERILSEKMNAYYAVARGSANPPRFIHLTWTPKGECRGHIALVGKGLTFDSGGLDIKPSEHMTTMKGDKSGACAVLGAIRAAALLELPWKVSVIIAAAENMPGGSAYRPDDILRARNGKTIEINNTDAEGRLTLADALCYASELKPDKIIDIATLTGACAVALGSTTAGLFTNNDGFAEIVLSAAKQSGERFWKLPMDDPNLRKAIKSPVADMVNSGGRYGGAITAAMFLEAFVDKDIPWVHLDIAAADFVKDPWSYYVNGASGFGMRTLAALIMKL